MVWLSVRSARCHPACPLVKRSYPQWETCSTRCMPSWTWLCSLPVTWPALLFSTKHNSQWWQQTQTFPLSFFSDRHMKLQKVKFATFFLVCSKALIRTTNTVWTSSLLLGVLALSQHWNDSRFPSSPNPHLSRPFIHKRRRQYFIPSFIHSTVIYWETSMS